MELIESVYNFNILEFKGVYYIQCTLTGDLHGSYFESLESAKCYLDDLTTKLQE